MSKSPVKQRLRHALLVKQRQKSSPNSISDHSASSSSSPSGTTTTTTRANDARWDAMYQGLLHYQRQHDSLKVPRNATWNGQSLYEWIRNNRKHYLNGLKQMTPALSDRRIQALRDIGFDFDPTGILGTNDAVDDKRWVAMFEGLVEFQDKYGHCSVPVGYLCDGRSLLDWIRHQRSQYTNALQQRRPALSQERTERLLSIGFELDPTGQRQDTRTEPERWQIMYEGLYEYYQRNKTFVLPEGYSYDGRSLFSWARNQKRLFVNHLQGAKPCLSRERIELLNKIGFIQARCKSSVVVIPHKAKTASLPSVAKRSVIVRSSHPLLYNTRRQLPSQQRRRLRQVSIDSSKRATTEQPALPSWVVSLAMDTLKRYQAMTPQERCTKVSY